MHLTNTFIRGIVDILNTIKYWSLNFVNPSIGCRVMWPQHYDTQAYRQTDIHTYRQTYIHTDRQTEPKYDID